MIVSTAALPRAVPHKPATSASLIQSFCLSLVQQRGLPPLRAWCPGLRASFAELLKGCLNSGQKFGHGYAMYRKRFAGGPFFRIYSASLSSFAEIWPEYLVGRK